MLISHADDTVSVLNDRISKFEAAFNANDLEGVMAFFSDAAIYEPGDGRTHRGKAEIRAAFDPQFDASLGTMRFEELDRLIDAEHRKAAVRWVCRHDITRARPRGLPMALRRIAVMLTVGPRFGWIGADVFHFDAENRITAKFSYGTFGTHPLISRVLG